MEGARSYDCGIDNLKATELRLALPGTEAAANSPTKGIKRSSDQEIKPMTKAQLVGWPPIRSYMKNNSFRAKAAIEADGVGKYVKVSMDGAPYLRKIDLKVYQGYNELSEGLKNLFKFFSSGCNHSDYAITYEDKDGDWMLVGDVPWGMFISFCKRLRIMRGSEARGLDSNQ